MQPPAPRHPADCGLEPDDFGTSPPSRDRVIALARQVTSVHHRLCEAIADHGTRLSTLPLDLDLGVHAGMGRSDVRALQAAVAHVRPLAATWAAFGTGRISWQQIRTITCIVCRLPVALRAALDDRIAVLLADAERWHADDLVTHVEDAAACLSPTADQAEERVADRREFVALQPALTGGGSLYAELGTETFAVVESALANIVAREGLLDSAELDPSRDDVARAHNRRLLGHARALALRTLAEGAGGTGSTPVSLTLVATLDSLTGASTQPAQLLHGLTGGRMNVTAKTARRLVDERETLVRTVTLDDTGEVLGVGRRSRRAPGWLTDLVRASHPTCVIPGCTTATTDLDHHVEWADRGGTDASNLAPLCRRHHTEKSRGVWTIRSEPDGTRLLIHAETGVIARQPALPMFRPGDGRPPRGPTPTTDRARAPTPA